MVVSVAHSETLQNPGGFNWAAAATRNEGSKCWRTIAFCPGSPNIGHAAKRPPFAAGAHTCDAGNVRMGRAAKRDPVCSRRKRFVPNQV